MDDYEQPQSRGGRPPGIPQYAAGSKRSVARLQQLNYDPIGELVSRYRALEEDIKYYRGIKDGTVVELLANGKPRAFSYDVLMQLEDRLIGISDKLLRYGYGRVPETTIVETPKTAPFVVHLTKKGETYVLNPDDDVELEHGNTST